MTALQLFTYIALAILAQIGVLAAIAFLRHWFAYVALKRQIADMGADPNTATEADVPSMAEDQAEAWSGYRDFRVTRKVFEDESHSVCSFYLSPVDGKPLPAFEPGQFLTFRLGIDGPPTGKATPIVRCYSLSVEPGLGHYRISVKRAVAPADAPNAPPGLSSNYLHDHVCEGDVLAVRAPSGNFFLQPGTGPVVFIAGGIGITPMVSMLDTLISRGDKRDVHLFYGARNGAEHAMKDHLREQEDKHPNVHLHICYSRPRAEDILGKDYHHESRVDITLLRMTLPMALHQFYICGPRGMMETLVPALSAWGVPESSIHFEAFGPASVPHPPSRRSKPAPDAIAIPVTFNKSGKTLTWDGQDASLLEFAEASGINVDCGCRAGACGVCETAIEEGEVAYDNSPDHEPQSGHCLLCVARPVRALTLQA